MMQADPHNLQQRLAAIREPERKHGHLETSSDAVIGGSVPRLRLRRASEIEPKAVDWLMEGYIPAGMVTLLAGYGGCGKSTVALSIAAACSVGGKLPNGDVAPICNTMILAAEDSAAHTTVPRLAALGADMDRILLEDGLITDNDQPGWVQLRQHILQIEEAIVANEIGLVIIDPVSSYIDDANSDRESDVRQALMPVVDMAERRGCTVLLIRHVSKSGQTSRAASRILGSTAWHDVPRSVLMLAELPDVHQPEPRADGTQDRALALGVVKLNLAAKPTALMCIQSEGGNLDWAGSSPVTIDDCFAPQAREGTTALDTAVQWLEGYLAGGSKPTLEMEAAAIAAGISKPTLRRARTSLGVKSYQLPGKKSGGWLAKLPNGEPVT